ncbi:class I SAM-dependent methyltransferase [Sporosarcina thermotolerans]|uniref:Class I SAM-dependent methyltransferase n=1 Tax=Sporosarcina thermotolerans TaxID=633404 RepID=A0AAW9A712_9BACL|nr:class I SAM-dependent methyltransferase [Sporosarcina thermotolerans]MDW0115416.1 class I SAM-dependent methyltransferase [Sporosarcina thermotolerans]
MTTIITTAGRPDETTYNLAKVASDELAYPIVERKKRSILRMQNEYEADILVAGKDRYELFRIGMDQPFFFHPNSAAFRLKRIAKGETDPLIDASQLVGGDTFLDCTLGFASDSIIASYIIDENGKCTGLEADPSVAFLTKTGLKKFPTDSEKLKLAMKGIEVIHSEAIAFLCTQEDSSWDVVYIDPMFHAPIEESSNFTPLRQAGVHTALTEEWMKEAFRVCKRRVVVKERFDSPVFEQFNLERIIRPNTKIHFGYLTK